MAEDVDPDSESDSPKPTVRVPIRGGVGPFGRHRTEQVEVDVEVAAQWSEFVWHDHPPR
ncbi:hypothetical protein [Mycobacteroides abscessus]|uniref:hypothetical protein n=1 Tax=Mycobacteroides abscessus TaxID=36809 RepID=UPI0013F66B4C|nr:hypothetical protein [Mycobacteroides abscessus]